MNFGQKMAEKKTIVKVAQKEGEIGFSEEEIIEFSKPDSLLDKEEFEFTNKGE